MGFEHNDIIGGVDTHKQTHAAAAINGLGQVLGTATFPTTEAGLIDLSSWLGSHGTVIEVGVEGTGSWGKNLARLLHADGIVVREVQRPSRQHRRRHGKSDPTDAIAAAKAVLAGDAAGQPKTANGDAEMIRSMRIVRSSAMKARISCANQIHAVITTAPNELRATLTGHTMHQIVATASRFRVGDTPTNPAEASKWALRSLARRYQQLSDEIAAVDEQLAVLVGRAAPAELLAEHGVGIEVAAIIISALGDNPERCHSDSALAALAGTSPVDASSGRQQRHRLNRGGNRELNHALWRIVMVRLRWHQPTKDYMARRIAEGMTKREVIRCLKRYIARRVYKIYRDHLDAPNPLAIAA